MRLLAGFALVFVSVACIQGQLVVPQFNNNLNTIISLIPQFQGFLNQLDNILPQLNAVLSSSELQSLKDKITQVVLSQLGSPFDLNTIINKLRPVLQQFLGSKPQGRIDFDALLNQVSGAAVSALPGMILGLLSGRPHGRAGLNDILSIVDKFQLNTIIPQIEQFLGPDKLQQLQNQFFSTVVTALGNNWNIPTVAQALQQLVSQFVPQVAQMRIDWDKLAESALNGVVTALPSILIGAVSLFGKRDATDARAGLNDILSIVDKFQLNTIIPQIEQFLGPDKLQQLQNQFFGTVVTALGNNWNIPTVAQALQQLVSQFVPQVAQMRINWEHLAEQALNGVVTALPSILIGAVSLFGKRDLKVNYQDLLAQLPIDKLAQIFQVISNGDKATVLGKLVKLLQSFFPVYQGRFINFDEMASNLLNHVNQLLSPLSHAIFNQLQLG